jgi:hypothetical protein
MGFTSNRTLLEKADLAIRDLQDGGGYLLPAQAKKFMRLLIKQSELMGMATVVPMAAPKQQIAKIKFGSRVLRAGREGTRLSDQDRTRPDFSYMELDAKLFKAEVDLSDESLEDSIEREDLRQTIMELLAEAIGRDMEEVLVMGDSTSPDPFLAQLDGILVQTVSHVVDAGGAKITKDVLFDTVRTLPSEYLRVKKSLSFLTSVDTELGYRNTLAERATIGGDRWLETDVPVMYSGIPIRAIPLFPENLPARARIGWRVAARARRRHRPAPRAGRAGPHCDHPRQSQEPSSGYLAKDSNRNVERYLRGSPARRRDSAFRHEMGRRARNGPSVKCQSRLDGCRIQSFT